MFNRSPCRATTLASNTRFDQYVRNYVRDLGRQERRHRVSDLRVLRSAISKKDVRIWKSLQSRCLACREASALEGIWMYECMTVLADVAGHGHAATISDLHPESILEDGVLQVGMINVAMLRQ